MAEWMALSREYSGWTLTEIKKLTPRERTNWLELAKEYRQILRRTDV